jgi:tRNA (guanine-N7-)-methyltransferase
MADETGRSRAFFGRRKGHPLRPQQAALFETLLPRLTIDLTASPPAPASLFPDLVDAVRVRTVCYRRRRRVVGVIA